MSRMKVYMMIVSLFLVASTLHNAGIRLCCETAVESGERHRSVMYIKDGMVYDDTSNGYDVVIRDSYINGSMEICNDSIVVLENISLFGSISLSIHDNAILTLENSTVSRGLTSSLGVLDIYVHDNAHVTIVNLKREGFVHVNIYVYDRGELVVEDVNARCNIRAYNHSSVTMHGNFSYFIDISMYNDSTLTINGSSVSWFGSITAIDNTSVWVVDSNISMSINIMDDSRMYGCSSYIDNINLYDQAMANLSMVTGSQIYAYTAVDLTMTSCNYSMVSLNTPWIYSDTPGPIAIIDNSTIQWFETYSGRVTEIVNSSLNELYYCRICSGNVEANASGIYCDSSYPNYVGLNNNINIVEESYMALIAVNAASVIVKNASYLDNIFLFNVSVATVEDIEDDYLILSAINSTATCRHLNISDFYTLVYYSTIDVNHTISTNEMMIFMEHSNISCSYLRMPSGAFLYASRNSNTTMDHVDISEAQILITHSSVSMSMVRIQNLYEESTINCSNIHVWNTTIGGYINVEESILWAYNLTATVYTKIDVRNGNFDIVNGFIRDYSGEILSGIVDLGENNIYPLYIDYVYVYDASVSLSGSLGDNPSVMICVDYSILSVHDTTGTEMLSIWGYYSDIYVYGSEMYHVDCSYGNISITNTNVTDFINISWTYLYAYNSSVESINIEGDCTIVLDTVTGESINVAMYPLALVDYYSLYKTKINISESNISEVGVPGRGWIWVENSTLGRLFYTHQTVHIVDTNITETVMENYLFTGGDVVISSNTIVSGSYINLLHIDGDCNISSKIDMIIVNLTETSPINISIENTDKFTGIVMFGGSLYLQNSTFIIMHVSTDNNVYIVDSIINTTLFEDLHIYLGGGVFELEDSTLITNDNIYIDNADIHIHSCTVRGDELHLYYADAYLNNVSLAEVLKLSSYHSHVVMQDVSAKILYASYTTLTMDHADMLTLEALCSIINATSCNITSDTINIDYNISLYVNSCNIDALNINFMSGWKTSTIHGEVSNSNISSTYILYYYVDEPTGTIFSEGTILGTYSLKISYQDTRFAKYAPVNAFHVDKNGNVTIENYRGADAIFWVYTTIIHDTDMPAIISNPEASYEIFKGDQLSLSWTAYDSHPYKYEIYRDGTLVQSGYWVSGEEIKYVFTATETGEFNITIVFYDVIENRVSHTVTITVKEAITTTTEKTTETPTTIYPIVFALIITLLLIALILYVRRKRKT